MTNLLVETKQKLKDIGKTPKDIIFIGSEQSGHQCSWDRFEVLANAEYDSGFGGREVAPDLIIVFSDGSRLDRGEYDGSEWWVYHPVFKIPEVSFPMTSVFGFDAWNMLADIEEAEPENEP